MMGSSRVEANIPASDLERARSFYADKLGLTPSAEVPGVALTYRTDGGTAFNVYQTEYAGLARHTIAQWHVDDVAAEVAALKSRGITFDVFDMPGIEWQDEVASIPEMGHAAWFTDSEGNVMCIDDGTPGG